MKISPVNNQTNFRSKIIYDKSLKKSFELARIKSNSTNLKDLDYSKNFIDSLKTILFNKNKKRLNFSIKKSNPTKTFPQEISNEGARCIEKINNYAAKLPKNEKKSYLDTLKGQVTGTRALFELLSEDYNMTLKSSIESSNLLAKETIQKYSTALQDELNVLEKKIIKIDKQA